MSRFQVGDLAVIIRAGKAELIGCHCTLMSPATEHIQLYGDAAWWIDIPAYPNPSGWIGPEKALMKSRRTLTCARRSGSGSMAEAPHIIAVDPGPEQSALVELAAGIPILADMWGNHELVQHLESLRGHRRVLAVEMVASYGMPVGRDVFDTVVWIGRFIQAYGDCHIKVYRKDVKMHLCGSMRAKDAHVRQALIDRFGPGKDKAIGRKATPGPLYGFKGDLWAALAVAVTYADKVRSEAA